MTKKELKLKYKENNRKRKQYRKGYDKKHILKRAAYMTNYFCKNGKITPSDLFKIAKKQKLTCPFTGQKLTNENISVDHIIPKSKGGINEPSNIRLVLKPINIAKQSMTDEEFINMCRSVVNYTAGGTTLPVV